MSQKIHYTPIIQEHPLSVQFPECLQTVYAIITAELGAKKACKELRFKDFYAMHVDCAKEKLYRSKEDEGGTELNQPPSVDMAVGVVVEDCKRLLLVEMKLQSKGTKNCTIEKIRKKFHGTLEFIGEEIPVYKSLCVLLVSPDIYDICIERCREKGLENRLIQPKIQPMTEEKLFKAFFE